MMKIQSFCLLSRAGSSVNVYVLDGLGACYGSIPEGKLIVMAANAA